MNIPKSIFDQATNPTLGDIIDHGLQVGDKLYSCICGCCLEATYDGLTDGGDTPYVKLISETGEHYSAPLFDTRFNKSKEMCVASAINQVARLIKSFERDLNDYRKLVNKFNIHLIS